MLTDLEPEARRLGIQLSPRALDQFARLLELLTAANAELNLTSIRDEEGIVRRHFLESIALGRQLDERSLLFHQARLLDLGSGAGFPGLPIKIVWPDIELTLLEATKKKARFLERAIEELRSDGARVLDERSELLAHRPDLREHFNCVVARALAPLPALVELAAPFAEIGGIVAAVKGPDQEQEIQEARAAMVLCGTEIEEHLSERAGNSLGLVILRKIAHTPVAYPRRPGQPAAHPIRNPR